MQQDAAAVGRPAGARSGNARVHLLDGFRLFETGGPVDVAPGAQRLVAFLALQERPVRRPLLAAQLWPDAGEDEALARLRSALWRVRRRCPTVVECARDHIGLAEGVATDVGELLLRTRRLLDPATVLDPQEEDPGLLCREVLPDWWDEWVVVERERLRQLRLHALESLAARLTSEDRFPAALVVALAAVAIEPLRESPHRCVISIHVAEGNRSEALRCYQAYRHLLGTELGVEPSPRMEELVAQARGHVTSRGHGSPRGLRVT